MAREVGDVERRRLERGGLAEPTFGPPGGWDGERWGEDEGPRRPLGLRLLEALPEGWRVPVGVGAVALAALLFLVHTTAGVVAGLLLVSLVTPGGGRWRRRW
jgi:hypothetical protein